MRRKKMKLNFGLKVDLHKKEDGGYRFRDYFDFFARDYSQPPQLMEFHLSLEDITNPNRFFENLEKVFNFSDEKGLNLSFHYPDKQIPSEVAWINNTLTEIGHRQIGDLKISSVPEAEDRLYRTIEILAKEKISSLPFLVTHKRGAQTEKEYFSKKSFAQLKELREEYLEILLKEHRALIKYCEGKVRLGLENTTPGSLSGESGLCEQAFEHFRERLGYGGIFVLDLAHAAMSCHYSSQNKFRTKIMDSIMQEKNPSLNSLEEYIKIAGPYTRLIHLSDATGTEPKDEGRCLGTVGSIIDWPKIFRLIEQQVKEPNIILEMDNAHLDYESTMGRSLKYLKRKELV